jgi:hypothetical protein
MTNLATTWFARVIERAAGRVPEMTQQRVSTTSPIGNRERLTGKTDRV